MFARLNLKYGLRCLQFQIVTQIITFYIYHNMYNVVHTNTLK